MLEDEVKLREEFVRQSASHDLSVNAMRGVFGLFYVPAVYRLSARVQPTTVGLFTLAYFAGYKMIVEPMAAQNL